MQNWLFQRLVTWVTLSWAAGVAEELPSVGQLRGLAWCISRCCWVPGQERGWQLSEGIRRDFLARKTSSLRCKSKILVLQPGNASEMYAEHWKKHAFLSSNNAKNGVALHVWFHHMF